MSNGLKEFEFESVKYMIDSSRKIKTAGDFNERTKTVFVDKDIPAKYHEGIALHEIVERKVLKKGHSYQYSHNEAQKAELEFYKKKYGDTEGEKILIEEEKIVFSMPGKKPPKRFKKEEILNPPTIQTIFIRAILYDGKQYIIDNSNSLIGDISDFYEKRGIIYIDKDVPERFFEGLAIYTIEETKVLKQGGTYEEANNEALKKERAYYIEKLGSEEAAQKALEEEREVQKQKFASNIKELKTGERSIINENVLK